MLSHHLDIEGQRTPSRRSTPAQRLTVGLLFGLYALVVIVALQGQSSGSGQELTGIMENGATPAAFATTG
ncbi:MAG: hypothetical protein AAGC86_18015 [Pseudomonadota bacterium]